VLNQCYFVVLDEADKMIDYNFEEAIKKIFALIPDEIQKSHDEDQVHD
jgi:superfamily II DNA/RNA helicase